MGCYLTFLLVFCSTAALAADNKTTVVKLETKLADTQSSNAQTRLNVPNLLQKFFPFLKNVNKRVVSQWVIPIGGNSQLGIHGDLTNVASGNLQTKGSFGVSINGHDLSVGAMIGVGGNMAQGTNNQGSVGVGGNFLVKPSRVTYEPGSNSTDTDSTTNTTTTSPNSRQARDVQEYEVDKSKGAPLKLFGIDFGNNTNNKKGEYTNIKKYINFFITDKKPF